MKRLINATRLTAAIALVNLLLTPSALGRTSGPVRLSLNSVDTVQYGAPVDIIAVLEAGADVQLAHFALKNSEHWQLIEGERVWDGPIAKGQMVQLRLRAVPLSNDPMPLRAEVRVAGFAPMIAALNPERLGGKFSEHGVEKEEHTRQRELLAPSEVMNYRRERSDAEPEDPSEPRLPMQKRASGIRAAKAGQREASVSVTATGRFTYFDNNDIRRPVRYATVELHDRNPGLPSWRCGTSTTDSNGEFSISATCGNWTDDPDLFVRIVLNNSKIEVKPDGPIFGSYTFETGTKWDRGAGTHSFGTITIDENRRAFAIHNLATRAQRYMASLGESMGKVTINFPYDGGAHYNPFFDSLAIPNDRAFGEVGTIFHEYAHHILATKAESPIPDYSEEHDDCPGTHCITMPETREVAWSEGFPNAYAVLMRHLYKDDDGYPATSKYDCETMMIDSEFVGREDEIEGVACAIIWDLVDSDNDDQAPFGPGRRDRADFYFKDIWKVVKEYDPSDNILHNHPTTLQEFWRGLRHFFPDQVNVISEVFMEHNVVRPQPDLIVSELGLPSGMIVRGGTFGVSSTVRNAGDERANNSFHVQFRLVPTNGASTVVGERKVNGDLSAGANHTAAVTLSVPATLAVGDYRLRACVDSGSTVPERDEENNCLTRGTIFTVR